MPAYLARIGVTIFSLLFAIAVVTEQEAAGGSLVAAANDTGSRTFSVPVVERDGPFVLATVQGPDRIDQRDQVVAVETAAVVVPAPLPAIVAAPASDGPIGVVLASWYGPGFYGNRTACGQTYTPEIQGVAHKTLPCGTLLTLSYGSRVVTVAVIDRGPYIAGRTLDLSNATKLALGCTDLCTLRMQVGR
jgi:rare lipoprotein A (peptidoglycan hydrolase)